MPSIDFAPHAASLLAFRWHPLGWKSALAEVIDNALDAGARVVTIEGTPSELVIEDNGRGCDNPQTMLSLGEHEQFTTTRSGVHGMGGKMVMLWLWGTTDITSIHQHVCRRIHIDWNSVVQSGAFRTDSLTVRVLRRGDDWQAHLRHPSGTRITYRPEGREIRQITQTSILSDLSWTFRPALLGGASIAVSFAKAHTVDRRVLTPAPLPRLVEELTIDDEIRDKPFRVYQGVIDHGESVSRSGFHLVRGHRVIERTNEPANGFDASRFFAWIELSDEWTPSLNKTELADLDRAQLFARLTDICEPTLRRAHEWSEEVANDAVECEITEELARLLAPKRNVKAKRRGPSNHTGTVTPTGDGGEHKRAENLQRGSREMDEAGTKRARRTGIKFKFSELDEGVPFKVEQQQELLMVTFNIRIPKIQELRDEPGKKALTAMSFAAVIAYGVTHDKDAQMLLPGIKEHNAYDALQEIWRAWLADAVPETEP